MAKKEKSVDEHVMDIKNSCSKLGWFIAVDDTKEKATGLIIGTLPFIQKILEEIDDGENYEIFADPSLIQDQVH